jgi:hypothetical protein
VSSSRCVLGRRAHLHSRDSASGSIKIDYGQLPTEEGKTSATTFYSRRLILPVLFTVQPVLRCTSFHIEPFTNTPTDRVIDEEPIEPSSSKQELERSHSGFRRNRQEDDRFHAFLCHAATSERYSCAQMTMFNASDYALECIVECKDVERDEGVVLRRLVAPGVTER